MKDDTEKLQNAKQGAFQNALVSGRESVPVTLQRSDTRSTPDQGLWIAIRSRSQALSFERYSRFVDLFLSGDTADIDARTVDAKYALAKSEAAVNARRLGTDSYSMLRLATEAFLLFEAGLVFTAKRPPDDRNPFLDDEPINESEESERLGVDVRAADITAKLNGYFDGRVSLPYLNRILFAITGIAPKGKASDSLKLFGKILERRLSNPSMLELIWSYWIEEGMLVQSMNAIALRFQNRRSAAGRDPLAELELDSLRPLNNVLWGYIQGAYTRLTVPRRAYEYDHHYGLTLVGKAVPTLHSADSRSKFLEAFHSVLSRASAFYRDDSDTTVVADAFPLLNALRELHLVLAEGAHNQFGDLPWTARAEMMVEQWMLARPEMKEFLRGRAAVPYQEPWIGTVDAMTRLQGWGDASASKFHELAVTGEQLLLTVRYHDWSDVNFTEEHAKNWARYWKNELQRYMHAYQAVTGVDLTSEAVDTRAQSDRFVQPSALLRQRVASRRDAGAFAATGASRALGEGSNGASVSSASRGIAVRRQP
jgi:hypothetical protein